MTFEKRQELEEKLKAARRVLSEAVKGLSDEEASLVPAPEEWSVKRILAHVNQSELLIMYRARRAREMAGDEEREEAKAVAVEVGDEVNSQPLHQLLGALELQRKRTLGKLADFSDADLAATMRNRARDEVSVLQQLQIIASHDMEHANQISESRSLLA